MSYCHQDDCLQDATLGGFCADHQHLNTTLNFKLATLLDFLHGNSIEFASADVSSGGAHLYISLDLEKESPETLRALKRACGKLRATGSPPYVNLSGTVGILKFTIRGAYECKYTCEAKRPGIMRDLSDGTLSDTIQE